MFILKFINIFCHLILFWCPTTTSCRAWKPLRDTLLTAILVAVSLNTSLGSQDHAISLRSAELRVFSIAKWKSGLETRRKDSFQNDFDTSVKRRSILTKAWSQSSALTGSVSGDRRRCVFSTEKPRPGHGCQIPQCSVHPEVIKLVWLLSLLLGREHAVGAVSASPVCSHNVGSALRAFTAVL